MSVFENWFSIYRYMITKYTEDEFINSKTRTLLKCECEFCHKDFQVEKIKIVRENKLKKGYVRFCSNKCKFEFFQDRFELICKNCSKPTTRIRKDYERNKTKNFFCTQSCSATYNNKNKKTGTRRSKLEVWIENELKKKYDFDIIFNGKEAVNSELDIYIPGLNLAFELNGIFHYEPIFGEYKLNQVKNNDDRKFQACLEKKIELCILDVSGSKHFKPERDKKYLDIIENIIERKSDYLI